MKKLTVVIPILITILAVWFIGAIEIAHPIPAYAQTAQTAQFVDKNGRVIVAGDMVSYTPAELSESAVTIAGTTTQSFNVIINTIRVHALTYSFNCNQGTDILVQTYAEDGTTALGSYTVNAGATTSVWNQVFIATELAPNVTTGTNTTPVRLPQRALSFAIKNNSASAATCTARLMVGY